VTFTLEQQFLELKEMEAEIKERRFALEQKIASMYGYDVLTGKSKTFKGDVYEVQFSASQVKKVNYEKLREIQSQQGIPQSEIERLFRIKAEVNTSEFNTLPLPNKDILSGAITVQINKPTLKITPTKKD
jgi:pyruvate dehydrogenase complex dehydrogenase (E1) component